MSNPDAIADLIALEPNHPAAPALVGIQERWGLVHHECPFRDRPVCLVSYSAGEYTDQTETWLDFFDTVEEAEADMYSADRLPGMWMAAIVDMRTGEARTFRPVWAEDASLNVTTAQGAPA